MTYTPNDPELRARFKVHHGGEGAAAPEPLEFTRASDLRGKPVPPREWLIPDVIPMRTATALYGNGGDGKSLLLLMLGVSVTLGLPWLGMEVRRGPAIILAAEDDADELHRRLAAICDAIGRDFPEHLHIRSAVEDGHLADLDPRKGIVPNDLYGRLRESVRQIRPALIGLDTLGNLFPGNENDRAQATTFVSLIKGLAMESGAAALLLAHPSLAGMASGSGLSGSTGWHNAVRSRLYLERVTQDGYEPDPNRRLLRSVKANYGPPGAEVSMTWQGGLFVAEAPASALDHKAAGLKAERVFLKLLREVTAQGRRVNTTGSKTYAPVVFAAHPASEGCTKRVLASAMEGLLARGILAIEQEGPPSRRVSYLVEAPE